MNHRLTRSTKVYVSKEGETSSISDEFVWCWMLQALRLMLFSQGLRADWLLNFRWPFYSCVWVKSAPKTLEGKLADWVKKKKKKDLLNCKYEITFQPYGCEEPTCAVMCFIHFGFSHHLDNIQLWNVCLWCFSCLFIVFACELIWNVLVNQKGFLYIKLFAVYKKNKWTLIQYFSFFSLLVSFIFSTTEYFSANSQKC